MKIGKILPKFLSCLRTIMVRSQIGIDSVTKNEAILATPPSKTYLILKSKKALKEKPAGMNRCLKTKLQRVKRFKIGIIDFVDTIL